MLDLINRVYSTVWTRLRREEGQTMVEYGLIVALIAAVAVTAVALIGTDLNGLFNWIAGKLSTATGS